MQSSVRARRDDDEGYGPDGSEEDDLDPVEEELTDESKSSSSDPETTLSDPDVDAPLAEEKPSSSSSSSFKDISFGALAKAQDSLMPPVRVGKRKRTLDEASGSAPTTQDQGATPAPARSKSAKSSHQHRTSKHAPQTLSTRHAVTRKRTVIEPSPALRSRDPRFDPASLHSGTSLALERDRANKNYSFLTAYRQSELQTLQSQLKAALNPSRRDQKPKGSGAAPPSDPETVATLKREIMSLTAKLRASEVKTREREILQAHKRKEKAAIREGRKSRPFHLKKGEVRREIERERTEALGKRAREKRESRRRKRDKGREGRGLPRVRRGQQTLPSHPNHS